MSRCWVPAAVSGKPTASAGHKDGEADIGKVTAREVTMMASLPLVPRWPVTAASDHLGVEGFTFVVPLRAEVWGS